MEARAPARNQRFADRVAAGRRLAAELTHLAGRERQLVLGLPRGGVPVAQVVAATLGAPWDVLVTRKIGVPGIPEVALGAIAEGHEEVALEDTAWYLGIPNEVLRGLVDRERRELERRVRWYRDGAPPPELRGRTVILVDDGLASGSTLRAAAIAARARGAARVIAAVPVAWEANTAALRAEVDQLVTVATPESLGMVSDWYHDFAPVTDDAVLAALGREVRIQANDGAKPCEAPIQIPAGGTSLEADLGLPESPDGPRGLVMLAHGGGSSRGSFRNRYLAGRLRLAGWATLRIDLLSVDERPADRLGALRFDVRRVGTRLEDVAAWVASRGIPGAHRLSLMGASTGAAAAMVAAAARPDLVSTVVSRGGRIDLAADALPQVRRPSLLIVGERDRSTRRANQRALRSLRTGSRISVVPGAGHTFEEPGALGQVGELAVDWLGGGRPESA